MLVIYRGHQARDSATYPPGRGCVALLDPFSSAKPQPNYPQMRPRAKYGGARSHPGLQPSRILNPHNNESSKALHTRFGGCVAILGPFSLCETDPKNAQTTSTAKYRSTQPPKTPTRTLYDNETSMVPHTCFGRDLHYVIPDPTNAQARLRAKHGSAQPPRPPDPQVSATYMTMNQIRCQTPASAGSFSLHQTRQGRNTGPFPSPRKSPPDGDTTNPQHNISCAAQARSARPPNTMINQTLYHTPTSAGVITSGLPSLCETTRQTSPSQNDDIHSHPEPCLRAKACLRAQSQTPTTDTTMDKTWHHTRCGGQHMKPHHREPKSANPPGSPTRPYPAHHHTKPQAKPH
ncbi:hypothetical protein BS47DRAFT_1368102 [Hydnum rufescens UP504]|uniref:Uncharacterized protein n=1 Tax=Hydnum rufescens UP504 TaxID=1448309 RepID=A0A9P6AHF6_9AGAM|nr:hypothetical protein BS47DRAFT_1368102 [Hydnum rufescens UP504]